MNWIDVEDRLPDIGVSVLFYWRPRDYKDRPFHREIIIGNVTETDADGEYASPPKTIWANGRHYDIKTFVTHWAPLPDAPELI